MTQNNHNVTCIVIDDNVDILDLFAELLSINNIRVVGTGVNGKDAYELYKKFHPDIIFIDVLMPGFDGFYGLEKIIEYDPHAKVIMVTGATVDKTRLDNADVTGIIEKPIRIEQVVSMISRIIKY